MRSLLLVTPDDRKELKAAARSGAQGLVLDLLRARDKAAARRNAADRIAAAKDKTRRPLLIVGLHALDDPQIEVDLDAFASHPPDAVLLPRAAAGADVQRLGAKLAVREAESGAPDGAVKILAGVGGSGASLFKLASFEGASRRLIGLVWSPGVLAAELGCDAGETSQALRVARSLVLFAAAAAKVPAMEVAPQAAGGGFAASDDKRLRRIGARARREGFAGMLARRADEIAIIEALFADVGPRSDV